MIHPDKALAVLTAALVLFACGPPPPVIQPSETASAVSTAPAATSTPSPFPPTPTATLLPAPRSFTEEFDAGAPYWQYLHAGAVGEALAPVVQAGTLTFEFPDPDVWAYGIYSGRAYEDVRIDAVVTFGSGDASSAGLMCRYDAGSGWYEFNIHPDRTYSILFGQWLADGIARYTPLVVSQSEEINLSTNEIGLDCQGDILTPYVNSVQLRRRQEQQHVLTIGQIGVTAASSEAGGQTISFDWVRVGSP